MSAMIATPFDIDLGIVPPGWIDQNGHMNVLHYLEASERATNAFYPVMGVDQVYRDTHNCGMFAAEHHIVYKAELRQNDPLRVTLTLLACDEKRIHFLNRIYRGAEQELSAAVENLELHVDLSTRRVSPVRGDVFERLQTIRAAHATLPPPDLISRVLGLKRSEAKP